MIEKTTDDVVFLSFDKKYIYLINTYCYNQIVKI